MQNSKKVKQLVLAAFFVSVELVLMLTPVGYIPIGPIRATTLHIPVILAGILMGRKKGAWMGFVFGLTSLLMNTFNPTITSFVFSPFITVGGIHGNFASLLIVFVPRILLGWLSAVMYEFFKSKLHNDYVSSMISSMVNTLIHTCLVMGGIYLFFGDSYAFAKNMSLDALKAFIMGVIATNGVMEMILAGIVIPFLLKALKPIVERNM